MDSVTIWAQSGWKDNSKYPTIPWGYLWSTPGPEDGVKALNSPEMRIPSEFRDIPPLTKLTIEKDSEK